MDSANKNARLLDTFDLTMVLGPLKKDGSAVTEEQFHCLIKESVLLWQAVPVALKSIENWWNEGNKRLGALNKEEEELFDWYEDFYGKDSYIWEGFWGFRLDLYEYSYKSDFYWSEPGREGKYLDIHYYRQNIEFYKNLMRRTRIEFDCSEFETKYARRAPLFRTVSWRDRSMQIAVPIDGIKLRVYGDEYQQCEVVLEQLFYWVVFHAPVATSPNHSLGDVRIDIVLREATSTQKNYTWTEKLIKNASLPTQLNKQKVSPEEFEKRAAAGLYGGNVTIEEYEARERYAQEQKDRKQAILWGIVGFLIPIVGIVLFLVWRKSKPTSAKAALIGAGIGFVSMYLGNIK